MGQNKRIFKFTLDKKKQSEDDMRLIQHFSLSDLAPKITIINPTISNVTIIKIDSISIILIYISVKAFKINIAKYLPI